MEGHYFRGGRWVIDLNESDVKGHLNSIKLSQDTQLIMNYFISFLFIDTSELGSNEFSERHGEIKDAIIAVLRQKFDSGARHLSAVIEGAVKKSLLNDGCLEDSTPYPRWVGDIHKHPTPTNFYQLLEGALRDPRSRIGRTINYPPDQEIYHVSEMIRNPLAHGSQTVATIEDYKVLFFILILLYHDLVNPHNFSGDYKYYEWINRNKRNMRLKGENPTLEKVSEIAQAQALDLDKVRKIFRDFNI